MIPLWKLEQDMDWDEARFQRTSWAEWLSMSAALVWIGLITSVAIWLW